MSDKVHYIPVSNLEEGIKFFQVTKIINEMSPEECALMKRYMQDNVPMSQVDEKTKQTLYKIQKAFGN
jgi:hypothetical protein